MADVNLFGGRGGAARGGGGRRGRCGERGNGDNSAGAGAAVGAVGRAARGAAGGRRPARGGVRNRVPQTDRQRLVDCLEAGEDYLHLANQLGINYSTARNIIRVWQQDGRVESRRRGGAHNVVVTDAMDEAIQEIALAAPFTTLISIKRQLLQRFPGVPICVNSGTTSGWSRHLNENCWQGCRRSF